MPIELAPNNIYGLSLRSLVLIAAGALGYGVEYARLIDLQLLGALVTRTTSLHPRRAAVPPRLRETPAGLLYTGGDVNPGLRLLATRYAPTWADWQLPVIVSVGGATAEQCAEVAVQLEGVPGVAGIELNVVWFADHAAAAVAVLRAASQLPLIVKLPLDAPDIVALAHAVAAAGADALAVSGAPLGLLVAPEYGAQLEGWLCGPALLPLALRQVARVAEAVALPVIGGGGIASTADARQFLAVGAVAVSIGAALLADPRIATQVALELTER